MNSAIRKLTMLALLAGLAGTAHAQSGTTWFGDTADGQWLMGIKVGSLQNNEPGFSDVDSATLVLGYQFSREVGTDGTSSIELELTDTDDGGLNNGIPNSSWDAQTVGLFLNYRTPGTVYFKGKFGLLSSEISTEANGIGLQDFDDTNFAYGAGFGVLLGAQQNINIEVEYMGTTGDNDLDMFNVGGLIRF